MDKSSSLFEGSCHCRAVAFAYRTAISPDKWSVRACQCTFCRAHSAKSTSDPAGAVEFRERTRGALHRYRFGQLTADFLICRKCGVYLGATISTAHGGYAIINTNALHPIPENLAAPVPASYENETAEQRIARREQRWTPLAGHI